MSNRRRFRRQSPYPAAGPHRHPGRSSFVIRISAFALVALAVIGTTAWLLRPRGDGPGTADQNVTVSMAGFEPPAIKVPAGRATTVKLINPDSPYHMDGGGTHQLAIPGLQVNVTVNPRSSMIVALPAAEPGEYTFYCDVCCGGKDNPAMQGKLVVS